MFIYTYSVGVRKINFSSPHPPNRNSNLEVFLFIAVLKHFAKVVWKHLRQSFFCDKLARNFMQNRVNECCKNGSFCFQNRFSSMFSEICFYFACQSVNLSSGLQWTIDFSWLSWINVLLILRIVYERNISNFSIFAVVTHEFRSIIIWCLW